MTYPQLKEARAKTPFKETHTLLTRIIAVTVQTGFVTAVAAGLQLAAVLLDFAQTTQYSEMFAFVLATLYANVLMATLNARTALVRAVDDGVNTVALKSGEGVAFRLQLTEPGVSDGSLRGGEHTPVGSSMMCFSGGPGLMCAGHGCGPSLIPGSSHPHATTVTVTSFPNPASAVLQFLMLYSVLFLGISQISDKLSCIPMAIGRLALVQSLSCSPAVAIIDFIHQDSRVKWAYTLHSATEILSD